MSVSLFCEFSAFSKVRCFFDNSGVTLNFIAQTKGLALMTGVASVRARAARGEVKCQKWYYGWLVLRPNGSVFAFKFKHRNSPDNYRYEVPSDFCSDIVDISASGKYVVGIKADGSLVEWYAEWMPSGAVPAAGVLPSGTLLTAVTAGATILKSLDFRMFPEIKPGDLSEISATEAAIISAGRMLVLDPVGSYPYTSGDLAMIVDHRANSTEVTVQRFPGNREHAAGVKWVVNGPPRAAPAQPTGPSAGQTAWVGRVLNRVNGSFLPEGNDFVQVCVAQGQGGRVDGPVFGLAVRQDGTVAQWGWFDGSVKGLPAEHSQWGEGDTKIYGLTRVCRVEVSAYCSPESQPQAGTAIYYTCNAAALLDDGMVVTWSPNYPLGWYDQSKGTRQIAWNPRPVSWNVALWDNPDAPLPGGAAAGAYPLQSFKRGGVVCGPDAESIGPSLPRYRISATATELTLAEISNINKWVELLPGFNATQEIVNRIVGVAGSISYRSRVYISPGDVNVLDLESFSGGYDLWESDGFLAPPGYSYAENCLKMRSGDVAHTVQGWGHVVSFDVPREQDWLWADHHAVGTPTSSPPPPVRRLVDGVNVAGSISEMPQLLHGIQKVFFSKIVGSFDYIYLKKDNALLSFELAKGDLPHSRIALFKDDWRTPMQQRRIPYELLITIWPDDSKSSIYEKVYTDENARFINLDYSKNKANAISSENFHNYGKVFGIDIVRVDSDIIFRADHDLPYQGNDILYTHELKYSPYDLSYFLHPSAGTLHFKYGVPQLTRHNGNGCEKPVDYWFDLSQPHDNSDCRPPNRQFRVLAGQMLDVPIFFNQSTRRPVLSISANNLPSWASLKVYRITETRSLLNFREKIDGEFVGYQQVMPLVRLSGIPDNVGESQVIPFTLTASNNSGSSEPAEFTILVNTIVEIEAEIIANCLVGALFVCIKNFYPDFRCAASIGSVRYADYSAFPNQGEEGAVYEAIDTGKAYAWSAGGYVETLARDLIRGADVIFPIFGFEGSLLVGGSWYFYGGPLAAFQANSQLVGRLQTLSLTRFAYGEFNAVPGSRALVFYYTTLNGRITPQPLLSLGVSFFDGDEPEYKEAFIAPRAFDYVSPAENSVAEAEIQIPADARHGIYNVWATTDLPPGDVKAHVAINLVRG